MIDEGVMCVLREGQGESEIRGKKDEILNMVRSIQGSNKR